MGSERKVGRGVSGKQHLFSALYRSRLERACRLNTGRLGRMWRRLRTDCSGMSGVIMAATLIPIVAVIGVATDVSRAYIVKQRLGTALDAAALAGGRSYYETNRHDIIEKFFVANFPDGFMGASVSGPDEVAADGTVLPDDHVYTADDTILRLRASAEFNTLFMQLFGHDSMRVSEEAEVTREVSLMDVVLAIDLSGSMRTADVGSETRIGAAKNAAKTMVEILFGENEQNTLLNIGLVPWSGTVNVALNGTKYGFESDGVTELAEADKYTTVALSPAVNNPYKIENYRFDKGYFQNKNGGSRNSSDLSGKYYEVLQNYEATLDKVYYAHNAPSVPLLAKPPKGWKGCVYARYAREEEWDYDEYPANNNSTANDNSADTYDGPVDLGGSKPNWVGWYPMGEELEYNRYAPKDDPDDEDEPKYYDGYRCHLGRLNNRTEKCTPCPEFGITPLQNTKTTIWNAIDELDALSGSYTNIPQGLAWAWRTISAAAPFLGTVVDSTTTLNKVVILLTDGANPRRSGDAYNRMITGRDDRLKAIATNMKQQGIIIYTIQFAESSGSLGDLLKAVATDEDHYFFAPDEDSLNDVFREIANELSNLRLSK